MLVYHRVNGFSYYVYFIILTYFEETPTNITVPGGFSQIHAVPNNPKLHALATNERFNVAQILPFVCQQTNKQQIAY